MSEQITLKEIKDAIQHRIAFVKQIRDIGKLRIEEPYTKEHWQGYLAALDGEVGELQFLEKLYKRL